MHCEMGDRSSGGAASGQLCCNGLCGKEGGASGMGRGFAAGAELKGTMLLPRW